MERGLLPEEYDEMCAVVYSHGHKIAVERQQDREALLETLSH